MSGVGSSSTTPERGCPRDARNRVRSSGRGATCSSHLTPILPLTVRVVRFHGRNHRRTQSGDLLRAARDCQSSRGSRGSGEFVGIGVTRVSPVSLARAASWRSSGSPTRSSLPLSRARGGASAVQILQVGGLSRFPAESLVVRLFVDQYPRPVSRISQIRMVYVTRVSGWERSTSRSRDEDRDLLGAASEKYRR